MNETEYIYLLKCISNGKCYVGRTTKPRFRKKLHINNLKANRHINKLMQEDFNKYGENHFVFEIVEERASGDKHNHRNPTREQEWMIKLKTYDKRFGYNYNDPCFMHRGEVPTGTLMLLIGD